MKQPTYIKRMSDYNEAFNWMRVKNQSAKRAGCKYVFCLMDGPDDDYAIVDLRTAVDLAQETGGSYEWAQ